MKTYTYIVSYTSAKQTTTISDCDKRMEWNQLQGDSIIRLDTKTGTFAINMRHVTTIEEIINEKG